MAALRSNEWRELTTDESRQQLEEACQRQNPFAIDDPTQPRLLWHPRVHQHYGERCVFFMLRVQEHQLSDATQPIREMLRGIDITAFSIYLLWGYYDVLIKAWVTPSGRERLVTALDEAHALVANAEEFQVESIHYLWVNDDQEKPPKLIESHRKDIDSVYEGIHKGVMPDLNIMHGLVADGLVHLLPGRADNPVKFFVALSSFPNGYTTRARGLDTVLEHLRGRDPRVTVYSGIGFAAHLLRFVAPSYNDIRRIVSEDVVPLAAQLFMRTATYLMADQRPYESDEINPRITDIGSILTSLANILGSHYEGAISDLPNETQNDLRSVFRDFSSQLLDSPFEALFLAILRFRIDEDAAHLNRELPILLHFEFLFKAYVLIGLDSLGDHWRSLVTDEVVRITKKPREAFTFKDKEHFFETQSLGTVAQIANVLLSDDATLQLKGTLGDEWPSLIEDYVKRIRNPFAHGATFTDTFRDTFLRNWLNNAKLISSLGISYQVLADWLTRVQAGAE